MPTAPEPGPGYRFELTKQYAYDAGELEIVGVTTPAGQRCGLTPNQIWERQVRAKIEHALSEMSTIGFAAGYLIEASSTAWDLAQQHQQQHPIPDLTTETNSARVYRQLAKMWDLETTEPSSIES